MDDQLDETIDEWPPDEIPYLWTATLVFPHPRLLDDDQMGAYFPEYDGRWSSQTKAAIEELGASGLELNANWALTRKGWSCPGCSRTKKEIFRKSPNGILLAKLELHHDHLWEEANRRPAVVAGPEWRDTLAKGAPFVVETIRAIVTRFDDALICSECNAADGKAKRALGIDTRFSFAAAEIKQFVNVGPHRDHEINLDTARDIWLMEKPGFERRVTLLETLVDDLVANRLQRRMAGVTPARPLLSRIGTVELLTQAFSESVRPTSKDGLLQNHRSQFLARSVQKDTVKRQARMQASIREPTDEEYAAYLPKANPEKWTDAPKDWSCPCCRRMKRAVMRMSTKKQWSGSIRSIEQFDELLDQEEIALRERLFPDFSNELHFRERRWVDICSDCAEIGPRLQQERRYVGDVYLTVEEMRSVLIKTVDHMRHEIDVDLAEQLTAANWKYQDAVRAMSAFTALRDRFQSKMDYATQQPEARQMVFENLDFELRIDRRIEDPKERKDIMVRLKKEGSHATGRKRCERSTNT